MNKHGNTERNQMIQIEDGEVFARDDDLRFAVVFLIEKLGFGDDYVEALRYWQPWKKAKEEE